MNKLFKHLKTGKINDIINALLITNNTNNIASVSDKVKLSALTSCLDLSTALFDKMLANNSPVLRTIKGHAFEVAFEQVMTENGVSVKDAGGDTDIDLIVNGHDLQLKTPNMSGTNDLQVEYKTHKTHGAKSEKESMDYYHKVSDFAEFFVGLISYEPFKVFIVPKSKLPTHPCDSHYIKSPFQLPINGVYKKYINAFHLLGINIKNNPQITSDGNKELLPLTSTAIGGLKTSIILNTILRNENFRIWDMSIRGFARESAIEEMLRRFHIQFSRTPNSYRANRGEKADLVLIKDNKYTFVQVKGISTNKCIFDGQHSVIATETQLTRGRCNDHPTQSRLYLNTDFSYLILAVDPPVNYLISQKAEWAFFYIPTTDLRKYPTLPHRINPIQKFDWNKLQKYKLTATNYQTMLDS
jgi:hypothetical protein